MNSLIPLAVLAIGPMILCLLVIAAAWIDCRTFRIPNRLVASGLGIGLALNIALPAGDGFFSANPGALGVWQGLGGASLGLAVLFPLYFTGTMGAGDVKLMSMIGAFVGPSATLTIIFISFILGAALSIVVAARNRTLRLLFLNIYQMLLGTLLSMLWTGVRSVERPRQSAGRMPYALVIAGGLFLYLLRAISFGDPLIN